MTKKSQSVSKAEWGSAKVEFKKRLPEILENLNNGMSRVALHKHLNLKMSYRQFCEHLKKHLSNTKTHTKVFSPESKPPVAPESGVAGGGFVMPTINIDEGEDNV